MDGQAGKGDSYRPTDMKKFRDNWDRVFGKNKPEIDAGIPDNPCNCNWPDCPQCSDEPVFKDVLNKQDV